MRCPLPETAIESLGLTTKATSIRAGLVACTGNAGCRLSTADTKRHAEDIARWCEARVHLDGPVNIHLTGCHHPARNITLAISACSPTRSGGRGADRGLSHLYRWRFRTDAALGREIYRDVRAPDAPYAVERMLKGFLFQSCFARRDLSCILAAARGRNAEADV